MIMCTASFVGMQKNNIFHIFIDLGFPFQGRRSGICSGTTMSGRPNADQARGSVGVSPEKIDKIEANSCILGTFGCILTMNLGVNTCTG